MRTAVIGLVVGIGLAAAVGGLASGQSEARAQSSIHASTASSELITFTTPIGDRQQQLTVIDPRQRVMSIYHIELATGEITLKSVRNIHWDLQMSEFNGVSPLPREIRSLLERSR